MRVFLMTDLEGVAGVKNFTDWCTPNSTNYALAKQYLTSEVNSAVAGFFEAGATHITVVDGHGPGGIDLNRLDESVEYSRISGPDPYPFGLDEGFDVMAWVGQHAMAGTPYGHLPHTGNFNVADYSVNGKSVGEFAQIAMCGALYGAAPLFGRGDEAFVREADAFAAAFVGVTVKRGLDPSTGAALDSETAQNTWIEANHLSRKKANEEIKAGAERALRAFNGPCRPVVPPNGWERTITFRELEGRASAKRAGTYPSLLELFNDTKDVV